jgi:hypothetical protein
LSLRHISLQAIKLYFLLMVFIKYSGYSSFQSVLTVPIPVTHVLFCTYFSVTTNHFFNLTLLQVHAVAQAVSRWLLTAKARVRTPACGICGGKCQLGRLFSRVLRFPPVGIIPPWLCILLYHLGDEQRVWWWQFRAVVLPHWHEQQQQQHYNTYDEKVQINSQNASLLPCVLLFGLKLCN